MSDKAHIEGLLEEITQAFPVDRYLEHVRSLVSPGRFEHIVRVTDMAVRSARANGLSQEQVEQVALAAVLHDAARDMTDEELMELAPPEMELEWRHPLACTAGRCAGAPLGCADEAVLGRLRGTCSGCRRMTVGMAVCWLTSEDERRNERIRELA